MTGSARLLTAAFGLVVANPGAAQITTTRFEASGIPVILRTIPESQTVAVRAYLLGGTALVSEQTAGVEGLLLRALDLAAERPFRRAGGRAVLEATPDWTVTGFIGLRADLDSVWRVWSARFARPAIEERTFGMARGELLVNANDRDSDPDRLVRSLAWTQLFAGHPYRHEPWGSVTSLSRLTREDVAAFADEHLVRSRLQLVVVGDVSQADVEALVAGTLADLPMGVYRWEPPPPLLPRDSNWRLRQIELPTNYIMGYFVGPPPGTEDYYAFELATHFLSSLLFQNVRSERGLSYAVGAPFREGAVSVGGIYASTARPGDVYPIMLRQIESLMTLANSRRGWGRFLDQFTLDRLAQNMTNDDQAAALAQALLYFGDLGQADDHFDRLREVRPRDIRRVAERYMRFLQLAYVGDPRRMQGNW